MSRKIYRVKFMFWLDLTKDEEFQIAEVITDLKKRRLFAKTIRDGIRLICDLRAGRLEVLFELFPFVRAEFLEYLQSVQPSKTASEIAIEQQLQRIEQFMQAGQLKPVTAPLAGPKPMTVPQFEVPACDEAEHLALDIRADTRTQTAHNFVQSMLSLQQ